MALDLEIRNAPKIAAGTMATNPMNPKIMKIILKIVMPIGVVMIGLVSGVIQNVGLNTKLMVTSAITDTTSSVSGATKVNTIKRWFFGLRVVIYTFNHKLCYYTCR